MIPYFACPDNVTRALYISSGVTAVVLLIFGFIKSKLAGTGLKDAVIGAIQTLILGGLAAGVAFGVVKLVNSDKGL